MSSSVGSVGRAESRLIDGAIERIERSQERLCSFITVTPEVALVDAARVAAARAVGAPLPLDGLTLAVKDNIDVAGTPTTNGSAVVRAADPSKDAAAVRALREAGAVVLGKTNLHELAFGATSNNPWYGSCRNPWDTVRTPGGSSGGSAAAVAAGLCDAALGTDTGGSVRIPAALCGVTGLRPTTAAISARGVAPLSRTFDTVGVLARSAAVVARVFAACKLERGDARGQHDWLSQLPMDPETLLEGVQVAVPEHYFFDDVDHAVVTAVRGAAEVLAELGATVTPTSLAGVDAAAAGAGTIVWAEAYRVHARLLATHPRQVGDDTKRRLALGRSVTVADVRDAVAAVRSWQAELSNLFAKQIDLILTPSLPDAAIRIDEAETLATTARWVRLQYPWSAAHLPAVSLPCGFTPNGLPIGLQLAAKQGDEQGLLRAAIAFQAVTDWHLQVPPDICAPEPENRTHPTPKGVSYPCRHRATSSTPLWT